MAWLRHDQGRPLPLVRYSQDIATRTLEPLPSAEQWHYRYYLALVRASHDKWVINLCKQTKLDARLGWVRLWVPTFHPKVLTQRSNLKQRLVLAILKGALLPFACRAVINASCMIINNHSDAKNIDYDIPHHSRVQTSMAHLVRCDRYTFTLFRGDTGCLLLAVWGERAPFPAQLRHPGDERGSPRVLSA